MRWIFLSVPPDNNITRKFLIVIFLEGEGRGCLGGEEGRHLRNPAPSSQLSAVWHANEAKGSILLCFDPFASFVCLSKQRNIWQPANSDNSYCLDSSFSGHRGSCRGHGFESRLSLIFQALFSQPSKFQTWLRWSLISLNTNILSNFVTVFLSWVERGTAKVNQSQMSCQRA